MEQILSNVESAEQRKCLPEVSFIVPTGNDVHTDFVLHLLDEYQVPYMPIYTDRYYPRLSIDRHELVGTEEIAEFFDSFGSIFKSAE